MLRSDFGGPELPLTNPSINTKFKRIINSDKLNT